jgi:hypothetical protein
MPIAHRRQRSACHGKAGQRPQRQIDRERVAIEWIDFDAKNFAAENLAKRIEAAIIVKGLGRDPERLFRRPSCVRLNPLSPPAAVGRIMAGPGSCRADISKTYEQIFLRLNR